MIAVIWGTRPEIIKLSPVVRELENQKLDYFIIHTNQHYSENLDKLFLEELELPAAKYNLNINSGSHGDMTGRMLIEVEKVLMKEKPDVVLVEGDTNTVLAGALSAVKLQIKVGHVEAGLRSYYRRMPEEINRIMADHCSDYLFAPTKNAEDNLLKENISAEKIFITGNTIVDAVNQNIELSSGKSEILENLNLEEEKYFLITAHREENVDDKEKLEGIFDGLKTLQEKYNVPVIYPIHPRTIKRLSEFKINTENITLIDPVGYLDFLQLMNNAKLILTDSGGVQEETCIMKIPCVTLRENTERPETLSVGSNMLAGTDKEKIVNSVEVMLKKKRTWENPFGDGTAGRQIIDIITKNL